MPLGQALIHLVLLVPLLFASPQHSRTTQQIIPGGGGDDDRHHCRPSREWLQYIGNVYARVGSLAKVDQVIHALRFAKDGAALARSVLNKLAPDERSKYGQPGHPSDSTRSIGKDGGLALVRSHTRPLPPPQGALADMLEQLSDMLWHGQTAHLDHLILAMVDTPGITTHSEAGRGFVAAVWVWLDHSPLHLRCVEPFPDAGAGQSTLSWLEKVNIMRAIVHLLGGRYRNMDVADLCNQYGLGRSHPESCAAALVLGGHPGAPQVFLRLPSQAKRDELKLCHALRSQSPGELQDTLKLLPPRPAYRHLGSYLDLIKPWLEKQAELVARCPAPTHTLPIASALQKIPHVSTNNRKQIAFCERLYWALLAAGMPETADTQLQFLKDSILKLRRASSGSGPLLSMDLEANLDRAVRSMELWQHGSANHRDLILPYQKAMQEMVDSLADGDSRRADAIYSNLVGELRLRSPGHTAYRDPVAMIFYITKTAFAYPHILDPFSFQADNNAGPNLRFFGTDLGENWHAVRALHDHIAGGGEAWLVPASLTCPGGVARFAQHLAKVYFYAQDYDRVLRLTDRLPTWGDWDSATVGLLRQSAILCRTTTDELLQGSGNSFFRGMESVLDSGAVPPPRFIGSGPLQVRAFRRGLPGDVLQVRRRATEPVIAQALALCSGSSSSSGSNSSNSGSSNIFGQKRPPEARRLEELGGKIQV